MLLHSGVRSTGACVATPPSTTPQPSVTTTTPTPCDCVYNLHDPNLCSPDANCPNTGNEFTFERRADNMCYAIINCPANSKIAVRYSSGISQRDIPLQDFRNTHNIACTANKWTVYDATNTARDITHIVCQIPKARGVPIRSKPVLSRQYDIPEETNREEEHGRREDTDREPKTPVHQALKERVVEERKDESKRTRREISSSPLQQPDVGKGEPVCSICSSSAIQAIERGCFPDDFYCTRAQIESTFNASSGCTDLSIKCPGDQIQLTLDAGSTVIAYSNEVRCDGGWNLIDDNLVSHRIVSMKCLNNGLRPYLSDKLTGECSCAQPVQVRSCVNNHGPCEETVADRSPNGCFATVPCRQGHVAVIHERGDATEVRERFAVNDTLTMMCANDKWLIKEEEKQIHLQQNDVLSCTVSSEISSNSTASSE
ncbi:hypothetical protein Q1695_003391 [Nippostrongylus brasiliensis]|nr:hypothetical protein Q1695_003391 [Nippostrongylus brasiliensis]